MMRIPNGGGAYFWKMYHRQLGDHQNGAGRTNRHRVPKDQAVFSERGRLLSRTQHAANSNGQHRASRIEKLRQQVRDGSYRVDSNTLARRILTQHRQKVVGN